jgi:Bacterial dnaA protein helix-turn-helix
MSEGISNCEIAEPWSEQRGYLAPIKVWRPRRAPPEPVLPPDSPRTLEEMIAAHKARQARIAAAVVVKDDPEPELNLSAWAKKFDEERQAREKAEKERDSARLESIALQALLTVRNPSIRNIIRAVADAYGVPVVDILSQRRTRGGPSSKWQDIVTPRMVAAYLAKTMTLRSLPEIGRQFGGRDHTTILHSVRKIAARIAVDDEFRAKVEALRAEIEGGV